MPTDYAALPKAPVRVDAGTVTGPLELWRHTVGHGGINSHPLPPAVVEGTRRLRPRLIRVFLQEFFAPYPDHGRFDWSRLDPYVDALAATGAKVVAAITLKPPVLFPQIDHSIRQPTSVEEWQRLLFELVRRYSVERPVVTHWEIGNETDIGEHGGSPYLIPDPAEYFDFYRTAVAPILNAFPEAKVGGPAACWVDNEPLPGFVRLCRENGTQLDFISWHLYSDDAARHAVGVEKGKALIEGWPGPRPELMVTEWSKSFDPVSVEELAFEPRRAALAAAAVLAMLEAGLDWSFYYHLWDQTCYPEEFAPFFSSAGVDGMLRHWNEVPHRFGLFGVGQEPRPQYFLYRMLAEMGEERLALEGDDSDLRALAGRGAGRVSVLAANTGGDRLLDLHFTALEPGVRQLVTYRIDEQRRWSAESLEMMPVERREVATRGEFRCQVLSPADSVTLLTLT